MEFQLGEILPGVRAVVAQIPDSSPLKARLREFGFVPGSMVQCLFRSPGKDLVALELLGTVIAVRVSDLWGITARRCS